MEKDYPADTVLAEEQRAIKTIYVVKEGTCEILSYQNPLKVDKKKTHFQTQKATGQEIALGQD